MKRILVLLLACMLLAATVPAMAEEELTTIVVLGYDNQFTFDGMTYYISDIVSGKIQSDRYDIKLVFGEKSLDDWDKYIADMQALGLDEVLAVYQARYDRAQEALSK